MSSTRTPQTTPLINAREGLILGALANERGQEAFTHRAERRSRRGGRHRRQPGRDGGQLGGLGAGGGAEIADRVGVGEHTSRTAPVPRRFH